MKVIVKLWYEGALIGQPIIAELVENYGVIANIKRANVEDDLGWIVCTLEGHENSVAAATDWLTSVGVEVEMIEGDDDAQ
ncbi:MAG: NIL domain-containing protein [Ferrimicrobium sp.]|uniref:NIL domain-containing protein n=1 Tax=Ferrimicrobium sp. TaxID=2926050 RepID=UPI002623EFC3|nr:NIL domain-containing protein [Ferrimicrobium sp.]